MEITTNIFLSEKDIRDIITKYINQQGFELVDGLQNNVRSVKDIPQGASLGDVVGINANVKTKK